MTLNGSIERFAFRRFRSPAKILEGGLVGIHVSDPRSPLDRQVDRQARRGQRRLDLDTQLAALNDADFDLAGLGFDEAELAALVGVPTFGSTTPETQGSLDTPKTCPECGYEL